MTGNGVETIPSLRTIKKKKKCLLLHIHRQPQSSSVNEEYEVLRGSSKINKLGTRYVYTYLCVCLRFKT